MSGIENVDVLKADPDRGLATLKAAGHDAISLNDQRQRSPSTRRRTNARGEAASSVQIRIFTAADTNHPFTMTTNPAVLSTKSFTPQVPLYH